MEATHQDRGVIFELKEKNAQLSRKSGTPYHSPLTTIRPQVQSITWNVLGTKFPRAVLHTANPIKPNLIPSWKNFVAMSPFAHLSSTWSQNFDRKEQPFLQPIMQVGIGYICNSQRVFAAKTFHKYLIKAVWVVSTTMNTIK